MDALEWVKVTLRWVHVFAAILWIGNTYLFNFFEKNLERDADTPENVSGALWLVHGGGFYHVEKQKLPEVMPHTLHWFKWEAAGTWISGVLLVSLVYYHGGLLVEPEMSFSTGVIAGVTTVFGGWVVYDLLVTSPLGKNEGVLAVIGLFGFCGIAYALKGLLAPRAVLIHVGGMIGTIMAANVWMRILPSQRKMLEAAKKGIKPEKDTSATGPLRSKQNSYMVVPLVFMMLSNHYPMIHGSEYNWLILGVLTVIGWGVARVFRGPTKAGEGAPAKGKAPPMWKAIAGIALLLGGIYAGVRATPADASTGATPTTGKPVKPRPVVDVLAPTGKGVIGGVVSFAGAAPPPEKWGGSTHGECKSLRDDTIQLVKVEDGRLADVFVYVAEGLPDGYYDTQKATVEFTQKDCEFTPRVFGIMVEQPLEIGNNDRLMHNVKSPEFNQGFPYGSKRKLKLEEASVMAVIKCDVHPWMRAYAGVMEHPYFATSQQDGTFEIKGLVAGSYTLAAWHEKLGTLEQSVEVDEGKPAKIDLSYPSQ